MVMWRDAGCFLIENILKNIFFRFFYFLYQNIKKKFKNTLKNINLIPFK
jgi:hypothetical protein